MRTAAILLAAMLPFTAAAQEDGHPKIDPARVYKFDRQPLEVRDFAAKGWILDVGGGGEGIIGRIKGEQVVAIDLFKRELAGTPKGPLKIQMDATDLKFLDDTFPTATVFFTFMYMKPEVQEKALRELWRVLEPGGRLLIWDVLQNVAPDPKTDIAVYRFTFKLPKEEVQTGYGNFFPSAPIGVEHYIELARKAGFTPGEQRTDGATFFLELKKPSAAPGS